MASGQVEDVELDDAAYDGSPKWLDFAKAEKGQTEYTARNKRIANPRVSNYFIKAGAKPDPLNTPWCKYFIDYCLVMAGESHPKGNGLARSYLSYGDLIYDYRTDEGSLSNAKPGDIVVNWRGKKNDGVTGHIFFYLRHDATYIYGIGGNQGDAVTEAKFPISRLLQIRRVRHVRTQSRTVRAGVGAGVSETAATALRAVTPNNTDTVASQVDTLQTTAMQLAPMMKVAAAVLSGIAICLMLYVVYRRITDYKETGL